MNPCSNAQACAEYLCCCWELCRRINYHLIDFNSRRAESWPSIMHEAETAPSSVCLWNWTAQKCRDILRKYVNIEQQNDVAPFCLSRWRDVTFINIRFSSISRTGLKSSSEAAGFLPPRYFPWIPATSKLIKKARPLYNIYERARS